MPKKPKFLTKTLYVYARPINDQWVRKEAKKKKIAYSLLMDQILNQARERSAA